MVRAKKFLGQHFLKDKVIAERIVESLSGHGNYRKVLEIGPGTGVLTDFLLTKDEYQLTCMEVDRESIDFLHKKYPQAASDILLQDFLTADLSSLFKEKIAIIGNFPYNISSQIFFKVLEQRDMVTEVVGMLQKEVADRIAAPPGNKTYGILSVLLGAFYHIENLFTVEPHVFLPPPKVRSAVVRLKRNDVKTLGCDEKLFFRVVKQGFNNRRKTLRNALKPLELPAVVVEKELLNKRAEQLSVNDFVQLTSWIDEYRTGN